MGPVSSVPRLTVYGSCVSRSLDAAYEGFVAGLAEAGFVVDENLTIDFQNAQADQSNMVTISERFVKNKVDLILAIATPAAQAVAAATTKIPIAVDRKSVV